MESQENQNLKEMPDLSSLSETERLQLIAVMKRAKEFEEKEDTSVNRRQPMEGLLNKYTNVMKGWQHRWFLLDPKSGMLEYFEKEEHKKQRPRGFIHLGAAVICPSDEDSMTFSVSAANGETYRLRATDAKERQMWVDKLRSTAEYFTAQLSSAPSSSSLKDRTSSNANDMAPGMKKRSESGTTLDSHPSAVVRRSQHKAPAPKPHTLDPFKEVKEYLIEAEDYSHHLYEKCASIPVTEEPIGGLDKDLLLLKATSAATLGCLSQCLKMLEHKQGVSPNLTGTQLRTTSEHSSSISKDHHSQSILSNLSETNSGDISPTGSFSSGSNIKFSLPEQQPEGPIIHEEEVEDGDSYHDTELEGVEEHKSIILHLLSQLKLGMDLTKVVLPTFILERRSLLEMFADCMAHPDVFLRIPDLPDPESRMMAVVEWYLTSFHAGRQGSVAKKPYNPIIGETFHCSWNLPKKPLTDDGSSVDVNQPSASEDNESVQLNYCAEQVSHHPPVSAFYFECPGKQMCMDASIYTKSRFYGMSIGVNLIGKIKLKLLSLDEEYVFSMPSAYARSILTVPWAEMGDKVNMTCQRTNMSAAITFHTKPFYGGKLHRVSAEVKNNTTGNMFCKVQGEWNNVIEFNYTDGRTKTIDVNSLDVLKKRVRPIDKQGDFESRRLWRHVTNALRINDVNTATEHKRLLEERQREGERHRKETNTDFPTKFFRKEGEGWSYNNILQKGDVKGSL